MLGLWKKNVLPRIWQKVSEYSISSALRRYHNECYLSLSDRIKLDLSNPSKIEHLKKIKRKIQLQKEAMLRFRCLSHSLL